MLMKQPKVTTTTEVNQFNKQMLPITAIATSVLAGVPLALLANPEPHAVKAVICIILVVTSLLIIRYHAKTYLKYISASYHLNSGKQQNAQKSSNATNKQS